MQQKCEICGSDNIIHDEKRGEVICSSCGTVLDRIYSYQFPPVDPDILTLKSPVDINENKQNTRLIKEFEYIFKSTKKVRKVRKIKIDLNHNVFGKLAHFKLYTEDSLIAMDMLKKNPNALAIYKYLSDNGVFSGMKFKNRVILAFYLLNNGDLNKIKDIIKDLHVDLSNLKKVSKRVSYDMRIRINELVMDNT
ncbi:hypothetical protein GWK48_05340 [Metallosphaera tengchongensis]|uniref:TFIIB-type domain-containing protein n=1 Tax=Metallosphaera tengchongensis TaxID=1532350 RepID=A0A6N0NWY8_9CREN|nr:TFIIB-type zinc ribbon-containing protein [Metallosphaera tengchongensis]QKQ99877.1 hypothetical protein GWK48_05340 [Metallosphaera tengchongensis]